MVKKLKWMVHHHFPSKDGDIFLSCRFTITGKLVITVIFIPVK